MTITEFLLARIAEDEAVARDWAFLDSRGIGKVSIHGGGTGYERIINPARAMAECAAKRAIVEAIERHREEEWEGDPIHAAVLQPLAAVYADHPDYDEAWRV